MVYLSSRIFCSSYCLDFFSVSKHYKLDEVKQEFILVPFWRIGIQTRTVKGHMPTETLNPSIFASSYSLVGAISVCAV